MAFTQCLFRSLPGNLSQISKKYYLTAPTVVRSASALSGLHARESRLNQPSSVLFATALRLSPACVSKGSCVVNLNQVKEFSVSPRMQSAGVDHAKLWTAEKFVSASLLGLMPTAFLVPNPALDSLLAIAIVMHTHWGFEAIVIDYVRPSTFGNFIPKLGLGLVYGASIATLVGLFFLIFQGPGLVNSIMMFWKL